MAISYYVNFYYFSLTTSRPICNIILVSHLGYYYMAIQAAELHQGFSNYETFLVVLEIENNQQYLTTTRGHNNQDDFREWVESVVLPTDNTNPIQTDLINAALSRVNWQEAFLHLNKVD